MKEKKHVVVDKKQTQKARIAAAKADKTMKDLIEDLIDDFFEEYERQVVLMKKSMEE